jgi:hypothetical protein
MVVKFGFSSSWEECRFRLKVSQKSAEESIWKLQEDGGNETVRKFIITNLYGIKSRSMVLAGHVARMAEM